MRITIWSTMGGKASGHTILNVSSSDKLSTLIALYCKQKGNLNPCKYILRGKNLSLLDPDISVKDANVHDGDTLTLSVADKNDRLFSFAKWWIVATISFLIGIIGMSYLVVLFLSPPQIPKKYSVVIDAGSSHSELFLFSWDADKPLGTADDIHLKYRCFITGGVASYKDNPDDLGDYLAPCLKGAKNNIPVTSQPHTYLFFVATAGMRILRDFDPEGAYGLLARIREILLRQTTFAVPHRNVFIASGKIEGISGWTATNYLLGTLIQDEITSAVLDLGGASLQLSREFNDTTVWQTTNLTLFNTVRTVYSHTFLCYGLTEARHRHNFYLVNNHLRKNKSDVRIIEEPCMGAGQEITLTPLDFEVPCTLNTSEPRPNTLFSLGNRNTVKFMQKYGLSLKSTEKYDNYNDEIIQDYIDSYNSNLSASVEEQKNITYKVVGTSNAMKCEERIALLFNEELCNKTFKYGNCLHKDKVPNFRKELVAFSDVFTLLLPLFGVRETTTLKEYHDNLMDVCSYNFTSRKDKYADFHIELVDDMCFDGMYIYKLLTDGLGINEESWKGVDFTNKIQKSEVDWALGFIVNKTTIWPAENPRPLMQLNSFILLVVLFTMFIVCSVMLGYHAIKIGSRSMNYQRKLDQHIKERLIGSDKS